MRNLVYKEMNLSINRFFYILPLLLSLLFFIPGWIYTFVFMYFFWITVPQVFVGYTAQRDYEFIALLPVTKKDVVLSKVTAFLLMEGLHIILAVVFGILHNIVWGSWNFMMDVNVAFFGIAFMIYGIFNIIFLPQYFKTAFRWGKPVIYGVVATLLFAGFFEYASIKVEAVYSITESTNLLPQFLVLLSGVLVFGVLSYIAAKKSVSNYLEIK